MINNNNISDYVTMEHPTLTLKDSITIPSGLIYFFSMEKFAKSLKWIFNFPLLFPNMIHKLNSTNTFLKLEMYLSFIVFYNEFMLFLELTLTKAFFIISPIVLSNLCFLQFIISWNLCKHSFKNTIDNSKWLKAVSVQY